MYFGVECPPCAQFPEVVELSGISLWLEEVGTMEAPAAAGSASP